MNAAFAIALGGLTGGLIGLALHAGLKKVNADIAWARRVLHDPKETSETTRVPAPRRGAADRVAGDRVGGDDTPSSEASAHDVAVPDRHAYRDAFGEPDTVGLFIDLADTDADPVDVAAAPYAHHYGIGLIVARATGHFHPGRAEAFAHGFAHARCADRAKTAGG